MKTSADNSKSPKLLIIFGVIAFIGLAAIPMIFYAQIQQISERLIASQERANIRGNITTDLILNTQGAAVERQEAENADTDEELDDLRNITLAIADRHNVTIPDETRDDSIIFEDGIVTFDNGTKVGISNVGAR